MHDNVTVMCINNLLHTDRLQLCEIQKKKNRDKLVRSKLKEFIYKDAANKFVAILIVINVKYLEVEVILKVRLPRKKCCINVLFDCNSCCALYLLTC